MQLNPSDPMPHDLPAQLRERAAGYRKSVRDLVLWGRRRWAPLTREIVLDILGPGAETQRRVPSTEEWERLYQMRFITGTPWHEMRRTARLWGISLKHQTLVERMMKMWDERHAG